MLMMVDTELLVGHGRTLWKMVNMPAHCGTWWKHMGQGGETLGQPHGGTHKYIVGHGMKC